MAVSSNTQFSNASPGETQLLKGGLYATDSTPEYPVGTRASLSDGRVFRYTHFGAATNRGVVVSQDVSESGLVDTDDIVVAPASAVPAVGEPTGTLPGAAGSFFVEITLAAITRDQFAGGYLHVTDDTGEGYTYRIRGNTATGDPAAGNIRLSLYDRIQASLDATSDIAITGSLYANVEPATQAVDEVVAGVSTATMAADEYGWVQTQGVATVLTDGVVVIADGITVGSVAGSVAAVAAATDHVIGQVVHVGDDTGHSAVDLKISA